MADYLRNWPLARFVSFPAFGGMFFTFGIEIAFVTLPYIWPTYRDRYSSSEVEPSSRSGYGSASGTVPRFPPSAKLGG